MKRIFPLIAFALFAGFLTSCQDSRPFGHPPASKYYLITPGYAAGNIKLGADLDSVLQKMGKPDFSDAAMGGKVIDTWYPKYDTSNKQTDISLYAVDTTENRTGQQWVKKIKISDTAYRTSEGVGAGDSLINIARVFIVRPVDTFRYQNARFTTYATHHGMSFLINPKGICKMIIIYYPNGTDSNTFRPFY